MGPTLHRLQVAGIKYECLAGAAKYAMLLFAQEELDRYAQHLYRVQRPERTLYDHVRVDGEVERRFAQSCEADE